MYAKVIRSDDQFLIIRTKRISSRNLVGVILVLLAPSGIIVVTGMVSGIDLAAYFFLIPFILVMSLIVLISWILRGRKMPSSRLTNLANETIFPELISFDRRFRRIEINGREKVILPFDDVKSIKYYRVRSPADRNAALAKDYCSLGLDLTDGKCIVIANGDPVEAATGEIRSTLSEILEKPVRYWKNQ